MDATTPAAGAAAAAANPGQPHATPMDSKPATATVDGAKSSSAAQMQQLSSGSGAANAPDAAAGRDGDAGAAGGVGGAGASLTAPVSPPFSTVGLSPAQIIRMRGGKVPPGAFATERGRSGLGPSGGGGGGGGGGGSSKASPAQRTSEAPRSAGKRRSAEKSMDNLRKSREEMDR